MYICAAWEHARDVAGGPSGVVHWYSNCMVSLLGIDPWVKRTLRTAAQVVKEDRDRSALRLTGDGFLGKAPGAAYPDGLYSLRRCTHSPGNPGPIRADTSCKEKQTCPWLELWVRRRLEGGESELRDCSIAWGQLPPTTRKQATVLAAIVDVNLPAAPDRARFDTSSCRTTCSRWQPDASPDRPPCRFSVSCVCTEYSVSDGLNPKNWFRPGASAHR
jgi:hypothetical protein